MLIEIRYLSPSLTVCSNVNFLFSFTFPLIKLRVIKYRGAYRDKFENATFPSRLWLAFGQRRRVSTWAHVIYPCCLNYVFKSFIVEV